MSIHTGRRPMHPHMPRQTGLLVGRITAVRTLEDSWHPVCSKGPEGFVLRRGPSSFHSHWVISSWGGFWLMRVFGTGVVVGGLAFGVIEGRGAFVGPSICKKKWRLLVYLNICRYLKNNNCGQFSCIIAKANIWTLFIYDIKLVLEFIIPQ